MTYTRVLARTPRTSSINRSIESIDLFIGILWKRFGTKTKRAASGTEEEFNRCFALWQERKQPHLMFYFNTMPFAPADLDEHDEYGKVLGFKKRLADAGGLKGDYQGTDEFKDKIRKDLTLFINRFRALEGKDTRVTFPLAREPRSEVTDSARRLGSAFQKTAMLREHNIGVYSLAFSADGRLLASGDRSGSIHLWDVAKVVKKDRKEKGMVPCWCGMSRRESWSARFAKAANRRARSPSARTALCLPPVAARRQCASGTSAPASRLRSSSTAWTGCFV